MWDRNLWRHFIERVKDDGGFRRPPAIDGLFANTGARRDPE
jgi:hypothetical protein